METIGKLRYVKDGNGNYIKGYLVEDDGRNFLIIAGDMEKDETEISYDGNIGFGKEGFCPTSVTIDGIDTVVNALAQMASTDLALEEIPKE